MEPDAVEPTQLSSPPVGRAVEHLVLALPPMERACVLLKDVFDYSLEESAELVNSTVGGVKAALNRGRSKLSKLSLPSVPKRAVDPELAELSRLYVERFNRKDWDGLRELISADARLTVADRFRGRMDESGYFGVYSRWPVPLRLATGEVDGDSVIIIHGQGPKGWMPEAMMKFDIENHRVVRIRDYIHCPWVMSAASDIVINLL